MQAIGRMSENYNRTTAAATDLTPPPLESDTAAYFSAASAAS